MSQELHAIYEHRILRPLTPIDLPEQAHVTLTLHKTAAPPTSRDPMLGLMAEEGELIDQVVEIAMTARESHPLL